MDFESIRPDQRAFLTAVIGAVELNRPSSGMVFLLGNTTRRRKFGRPSYEKSGNAVLGFVSIGFPLNLKELDWYVSRKSEVV